jgi:hypothetical protein
MPFELHIITDMVLWCNIICFIWIYLTNRLMNIYNLYIHDGICHALSVGCDSQHLIFHRAHSISTNNLNSCLNTVLHNSIRIWGKLSGSAWEWMPNGEESHTVRAKSQKNNAWVVVSVPWPQRAHGGTGCLSPCFS